MNKQDQIAFYEKYLLTVEEAAAYFHIGNKRFMRLFPTTEVQSGSSTAESGS